MVFKKPYAFIIKHFRIIHLLLLIPMLYLLIKSGNIVEFFRDYVANDYHFISDTISISNLSASYVNIFMYLAILIIVGVYAVISFLLQNKEKPTKYYNISIIYYMFLFIMLTVCVSILQTIEDAALSNTFARIIRDIVIVIRYSEYIFIIFNLVRGVGFNLKKFNFESDVADLDISEEDSEEFEFLVGKDAYKTKRNIRRFFRELIYYYKENKFIFTIIFIIIGIVIGNMIYSNFNVYEKVYKEGESVAFGDINFKVNNSYLTTLDLNGKTINNDKIYLVLQITISNRFGVDKKFNYDNLQVLVDKKKTSPNLMIGNSFLDLGNPYNGSFIKANSEIPYILIYELDKSSRERDYEIESYSGYNPAGVGALSRSVKINPTVINSNVTTTNVNAGTIVNLGKSHVGNSTLTLNNYEFCNRFEYEINGATRAVYIDLIKDRNLTLMVMDYKLDLDKNSDYMMSPKDINAFFEDFMKIRYVLDNKTYYSDVSLANPAGYTDKILFKIDKKIMDAETIEAIVTARNISYVFKLK